MKRTLSLLSLTSLFLLTLFLLTNVRFATADTLADASVTVGSNFFNPTDVTISVGDTVTWNNVSGFHNVASTDGTTFRCGPNGCDQTGGNGGPGSGNWTAQFTFDTPGSFEYICEVHPSSMRGTINVQTPTAVSLNGVNAFSAQSTILLLVVSTLTLLSGYVLRPQDQAL